MSGVTTVEAKRSFWTNPALVLVSACLSLLGVIGIGTTAVFVVQQRQYNQCQSDHDDEVIAALKERGDAGNLDREALRQIAGSGTAMIDVLLQPGVTQDQRIEAIRVWRQAQFDANQKLAQADDSRRKHPLPDPRQC